MLASSFAAFIMAGTVLLWLPISAEPGWSMSFLDAFFTATSAVCVTGLIVVDTPNHLSPFGEVILLLLIQTGGLGYMTISSVLAIALGRSVSLQERLSLQEALNVQGLDGLLRFAVTVLKLTLAFELAGAAMLAAWWWSDLGGARALWYGLFHSVSAFNNAGFALWSDNLVRWRGDWVVNLVITALIISGGLGFFVLAELLRRPAVARLRRRLRHTLEPEPPPLRLSVHTRLVLLATAVLLVGGTVAIYVLEAGNPRTLGPLPWSERLLAAWFQSVSPRTAGFNTIDIGAMTPPALFLTMALMFIGASPGGTGGGVKTTTFGITLAALWAPPRPRARGAGVLRVAHRLSGVERRGRPPADQRRAGPAAHAVRDHVGLRHGGSLHGRARQRRQPLVVPQPARQDDAGGDDVHRPHRTDDAGVRRGAAGLGARAHPVSGGEGHDRIAAGDRCAGTGIRREGTRRDRAPGVPAGGCCGDVNRGPGWPDEVSR
jgi:trk system potassium uptake protein TrkH